MDGCSQFKADGCSQFKQRSEWIPQQMMAVMDPHGMEKATLDLDVNVLL